MPPHNSYDAGLAQRPWLRRAGPGPTATTGRGRRHAAPPPPASTPALPLASVCASRTEHRRHGPRLRRHADPDHVGARPRRSQPPMTNASTRQSLASAHWLARRDPVRACAIPANPGESDHRFPTPPLTDAQSQAWAHPLPHRQASECRSGDLAASTAEVVPRLGASASDLLGARSGLAGWLPAEWGASPMARTAVTRSYSGPDRSCSQRRSKQVAGSGPRRPVAGRRRGRRGGPGSR
jgi:hypothetical protein